MRVLRRGFFRLAMALAVACLAVPATTIAEDTCAAAGPFQTSDVVGLTWSGSVVQTRKIGLEDGYEKWVIVMAVDRVYAHLPNHDIPRGTVLAAGSTFELPSDNCGRTGDMGMHVGKRYLVSAGFVAKGGTALTNLVVWEIDGTNVRFPQGLYNLPIDAHELSSARTLSEALGVLGLAAQPTNIATPTADSRASSSPSPSPADNTNALQFFSGPIGVALAVVAILVAAWLAFNSSKRRRVS
ncbi:MAG TPA: hypothetical protein VFI15_10545 [Candidatus Limnocylindrales bacterium]|nr:hypothetical protein [Candidatus Limnocylindrales bacterium]